MGAETRVQKFFKQRTEKSFILWACELLFRVLQKTQPLAGARQRIIVFYKIVHTKPPVAVSTGSVTKNRKIRKEKRL